MPGREEALERAQLASRKRSLQELQGQFTGSWFPGGEGFSQPIIRLHDAAHQWSNISPSARGELQQNVVDLAGSLELYKRTGARGVINSIPFRPGMLDADALNDEAVEHVIAAIQRGSKQLEDPIKGAPMQVALRPNDPARLQIPPLTLSEIRELARRGQEFYGQVGDALNAQSPGLQSPEARDVIAGYEAFSPAPEIEVELPVNTAAAAIHSDEGGGLKVLGGYDAPGRMSYGPMKSRLNRALHYTVDEGLLMREAGNQFRRELREGLSKPRIVNAPPQAREKAEASFRRSRSQALGLPEYVPEPGDSAVPAKTWFEDQDRAIRSAETGGLGNEVSAMEYVVRNRSDSRLLDVAARARDMTKVRDAIRTGASATADIAGSVPLFDPEFRRAVESGNLRKAGEQVAKEYAAGAVAAPVVGAATGVLRRVAPRAAARVLPAVAGAARVGNPVAVVSQLGGSARQTKAQQAADKRAGQQQLLRAEAARRRGGRWKIGPVTIPELGISEAGGLFIR